MSPRLVSNPPYIPTKAETQGEIEPLLGTFWEGVGLVLFLLKLITEKVGTSSFSLRFRCQRRDFDSK